MASLLVKSEKVVTSRRIEASASWCRGKEHG